MGLEDLTWEIEELLARLSQAKIDTATRDLHFDWSDLTKLTKGQTAVLLKRLRNASRKTLADFDREAANSELIISMKQSLEKFKKGLRDDPG